ncbi:MAG: hypothetical protein K6B42_00280 [Clostridia bacterium]|nr:hypothetical protein [Clostridia bacterium]
MTKTEIRNTLRQSVDGKAFLTKSDLKRCLGCGSDRASEILRGLQFIRFSRKKLYSVDDVAAVLVKHTEV